MRVLKFNESINISYEGMVDELCRYQDYLSNHTYGELFELKDSHCAQRYEEGLVPVNDIRNYCWYENRGGGIGIIWKFNKKQMMNLKLPTTRSYVQEMYHVLQREVVSWNDVDDIDSTLISSLAGIKYTLEFVSDMFYCSWWIEVNMDGIKDVDSHFNVLKAFKLLDSRASGVKEVQITNGSFNKSKYILKIMHIKVGEDGKPIVDGKDRMRKNNIKI